MAGESITVKNSSRCLSIKKARSLSASSAKALGASKGFRGSGTVELEIKVLDPVRQLENIDA
jgi:hypothetical protein